MLLKKNIGHFYGSYIAKHKENNYIDYRTKILSMGQI